MKGQIITLGKKGGGMHRALAHNPFSLPPLPPRPPPPLPCFSLSVSLLQVRGGDSGGKDYNYRVETWNL